MVSELLLGARTPDDPDYEDLAKIHSAGVRGAELVHGLLAFSRKAETRPQPLDLNCRIEQVTKMLQRTIPKMIAIELRLARDLAVVQADSNQVEQILMNLAVNARDAMPDGGKLTIETRNVTLDEDYSRNHLGSRAGRHVLLSISDTGYGMDKETLAHIFEPFFTTKETGRGTGLGLATVYGIVKQHHGYITCDSAPGQGSAFSIYLPVAAGETGAEILADTSKPPGGTETILLVDDEEAVRELGERLLKTAGCTVLTATDGKQALRTYEKERGNISLVILDVIMPEMGGKECFEKLVALDPNVKVLISSGYTSGGTTQLSEELGAKGFLSKPYEVRKLLNRVREVLDSD